MHKHKNIGTRWHRPIAVLLCLLIIAPWFGVAGRGVVPAQAQTPPPPANGPAILTDTTTFDVVLEWQHGVVDNLLVTNNDDGELRLGEHQMSGDFISRPFETDMPINAAGAYWRADIPLDTDLQLELRGRATPPANTTDEHLRDNDGWGPWQPLIAGDARSQAEDGAFATPDVLGFPADTRYLQLRATFTASIPNASAILSEITIVSLNTTDGPPGAAGLPHSPLLFGADTRTPRPMAILRPTWSGTRMAAQRTHATPYGVVLHQIATVAGQYDTLPLLRALAAYQTDTLGWDDMSYHFLIDESGVLYEGRMGGPTSSVSRLAGGDTAIHIALVGTPSEPPSEAALQTLVALLAWVGEAYDIHPLGEHRVAQGDAVVTRPNIAAHNTVAPEAPDPGTPLRELLPDIRRESDEATVRSRWFFPEGNALDYTERLMFFNPTSDTTDAYIGIQYDEDEPPLIRAVTVPAVGHADLLVNSILTGTGSLSAITESSRPIIAERSMASTTDINANAGITELSRIWYFAEGSTDEPFETYLVLFNPNPLAVEARLTYMKGDGTIVDTTRAIPAGRRLVVTASDDIPGKGFGTRIIASHPIAAERTMRFGTERTGMHTSPGTSRLSREWYFAEGTTAFPFTMRILALNPNDQPANTVMTFMTPDGTSLKRQYAIPPTTRLVVDVNEVVPMLGVATTVTSDRPLAVERALYFDPQELARVAPSATELITATDEASDRPPTFLTPEERTAGDILTDAGTVSFGAMEPTYTWHFAYGRTSGTREYLLFINPSRGQARVTTEVTLSDGSQETQSILMPAGSRYTLALHDFYPDQPALSATVRSTQPIVAERSLFATDGNGGGSTSLGVPGE